MPQLKTLFDLNGRTALVTGGSRGLGLQIAEALGEFGAHVIITARKENELKEAESQLAGLGVQVSTIAADLGRPEEPVRVAEAIAELGLSVDILVNNAGTSWACATEELPIEAWNKVVSLNLTAPFLLAQQVAKRWMLPRRRGRIINIASVEGQLGHHPRMAGTAPYNASKGGLINFTRALAAEWGPHGVTVNAIAPGYFPSRLTTKTLETFEKDLVYDTPRGQLGGPDDLKGATVLLASDAGAHILGQVLVIDGGASVI